MWLCNQWWVWLWSLKLFWKSWSLFNRSVPNLRLYNEAFTGGPGQSLGVLYVCRTIILSQKSSENYLVTCPRHPSRSISWDIPIWSAQTAVGPPRRRNAITSTMADELPLHSRLPGLSGVSRGNELPTQMATTAERSKGPLASVFEQG